MAAGGDGGSVGQHHIEPDDDVLDLAVAVGELPRATTGQPTSHGGQGHGLGPVTHGETMLGLELLLEQIAEGAGKHIDDL